MKKIVVIFAFLTANSMAIATSAYYFGLKFGSNHLSSASQYFTDSAVAYFNPLMRLSLLYYVAASFLVAISLILAIHIKNRKFIEAIFQDRFSVNILLFSIPFFISLCFIKSWINVILIQILLWAAIFLALRRPSNFLMFSYKIRDAVCEGLIAKIVLLGAAAFTVFLFAPLVFSTPNIMNAFFRIPEMYNVGQVSEAVKSEDLLINAGYKAENKRSDIYVDTTTLHNDFNLFQPHDYVDIFNYRDWKSNQACMEVEADDLRLSMFIDEYNRIVARPAPHTFWEADKKLEYPGVLHYSENRLCFIAAQGRPDYVAAADTDIRRNLTRLGIDSRPFWNNQKKTVKEAGLRGAAIRNAYLRDSAQQKMVDLEAHYRAAIRNAYLRDSELERGLTLNGRGQLRHHIYYMYPSYEYLMGKPIDKMVIQYGVGHTLFLSAVGKTARFIGVEPTYGSAVKFLACFSCLGFAVFVLSLSLIFRDIRLTSLAALVAVLNFVARKFDVNIMVGGLYDLRVIFDLPAVCCLYYYCLTKKDRFLWGLLGLLLFSLLYNFEFGLFLTAAMFGALVIYRLMEQANAPGFGYLAAGLAFVALAYYLNTVPAEGAGSSFMLGFFSQKMSSFKVGCFVLIFAVYVIMFLHMRASGSRFSYSFLATAFYSQTIMCYYVWNGHNSHFNTYLARIVLPVFFYFAFLFLEKTSSELKRNIIYGLAVAAVMAVVFTQYRDYRIYGRQFNKTFKTHKVYSWDKRGTNINSTMNPAFFEPAVLMIEKYLPDRKDLYMISQYDFLLTYLAGKYSSMPHYDLSGNLITADQIEYAVDNIRLEKPEYIFVDSDINVPYELNLPNLTLGPQLYVDARCHILSLNSMRAIYKAVIGDYALVEQGRLISVYRLKEKPAPAVSPMPSEADGGEIVFP